MVLPPEGVANSKLGMISPRTTAAATSQPIRTSVFFMYSRPAFVLRYHQFLSPNRKPPSGRLYLIKNITVLGVPKARKIDRTEMGSGRFSHDHRRGSAALSEFGSGRTTLQARANSGLF